MGDPLNNQDDQIPKLLSEVIQFDPDFLPVLKSHTDPISLGQLVYEARESGADHGALTSARIWVASAKRRSLVEIEEQGIRLTRGS